MSQPQPFPVFEANEIDRDALADIIWFIKGRMSAYKDRDERCEMGQDHIESLRRFRCDHPKISELLQRCHDAERREAVRDHFAKMAKPLAPIGKKARRA